MKPLSVSALLARTPLRRLSITAAQWRQGQNLMLLQPSSVAPSCAVPATPSNGRLSGRLSHGKWPSLRASDISFSLSLQPSTARHGQRAWLPQHRRSLCLVHSASPSSPCALVAEGAPLAKTQPEPHLQQHVHEADASASSCGTGSQAHRQAWGGSTLQLGPRDLHIVWSPTDQVRTQTRECNTLQGFRHRRGEGDEKSAGRRCGCAGRATCTCGLQRRAAPA